MFKLSRGQASITEIMILSLIIVSLASLGVYYMRELSESLKTPAETGINFELLADIKQEAMIKEYIEKSKIIIDVYNPYDVEIDKYPIRIKLPEEFIGKPLILESNSTSYFAYEYYDNYEVGEQYSRCNGYIWISTNLPAKSLVRINITEGDVSNASNGKYIFDIYEDFNSQYTQFSTISFGSPANFEEVLSNGLLKLSYQTSNENSGVYLVSSTPLTFTNEFDYIIELYGEKNYDVNILLLTDPSILNNYFWIHKDEPVLRFGRNSGNSFVFFNLVTRPTIYTASFSVAKEKMESNISYKEYYTFLNLNSASLMGNLYNTSYYLLVGIGNSAATDINKYLTLEWIRVRKYSKEIEKNVNIHFELAEKTYYNVLTIQIKNTGEQTMYLDKLSIIVMDSSGEIIFGPVLYEEFGKYNISTYPENVTQILPGRDIYIFIPMENILLSGEKGIVKVMYGEIEKETYIKNITP